MPRYTLLQNLTFEDKCDCVSFHSAMLEKAKLIRHGVKEDSIRIVFWDPKNQRMLEEIPNNTIVVICGFAMPAHQKEAIEAFSLNVRII